MEVGDGGEGGFEVGAEEGEVGFGGDFGEEEGFVGGDVGVFEGGDYA